MEVFVGGAHDVCISNGGGEHATDQVGKGGDAVHEDPEAGHAGRGGKDTREEVILSSVDVDAG